MMMKQNFNARLGSLNYIECLQKSIDYIYKNIHPIAHFVIKHSIQKH